MTRIYQVFGSVTVSCYVRVEAESAEEAVLMAQSVAAQEGFEIDADGQPDWVSAEEE